MVRGSEISGPTRLRVGPNSKENYQLDFLPLALGASKATVTFSSSVVGEVMCIVNTHCLDEKPKKLPLFVTAIGKTSK